MGHFPGNTHNEQITSKTKHGDMLSVIYDKKKRGQNNVIHQTAIGQLPNKPN
jgi:hypothetical protein